jgi:hypothetical protein
LDYEVAYPEPKYHGADFIFGDDRAQFSGHFAGIKECIFTIGEIIDLQHGRRKCTEADMLYLFFVFGIAQDGLLSASYNYIVHLQHGVPCRVSETRP